MKIKILYIISNLDIGGAQVLLLSLLKSFANNPELETIVVTLNSGKYKKSFSDLGVTVIDLKIKSLINPGIFTALYKVIKEVKPDIVHTNLLKADFYGRIVAKFSGVKNIVTTYHTNSSSHKIVDDNSFQFYNFIDKIAAKYSKCRLIAVSETVKNYLNNRLSGLKHEIIVINNGINIENIQLLNDSGKNTLRSEFNLSSTDYIISFIGRLETHKAPDFFVESMSSILNAYDNVKLLLIGEGNLREKIEEYILKNNFKNRIFLTGFRENPLDFVQISNLVVVPSLVEGFGIIILESLLLRTLVLGSDAGAIPEIITDGVNGFIFKAGDKKDFIEKFKRIYTKKDINTYLDEGYKHVVRNFDIKSISNKYYDFYKKIVLDN